MRTQNFNTTLIALYLFSSACTAQAPGEAVLRTAPPGTARGIPLTTAPQAGSPTDVWKALFGRTPLAWTTPLPPRIATGLDATYVKMNPRPATPFPCKRCPDYALEGGLWKFSLDQGTFRIFYAVNGWRSLGSYAVVGDRLYLFNDPYCHLETGSYTWILEAGILVLSEVDDPCLNGLRAANLTDQPWLSCRAPNPEAGITDHWQKPEGCDPQE